MALMDKPLPEDVTDTDIIVPLEEDGDVVERKEREERAQRASKGIKMSVERRRGDQRREQKRR